MTNTAPESTSGLLFRDVGVRMANKFLLRDVCGLAPRGTLTAIMGPSGAGKSTLLNTLMGLMPMATGEIFVNGQAITKRLRRQISYVVQEDIFLSSLTLAETLHYTALLRLPERTSASDRSAAVDAVVDSLELRKCLHTSMGNFMDQGLSGGEKKRASIACELLTDPNLMLLDEPTSGLDSAISRKIINSLKEMTAKGRTILATIHQPSSQIFYLFDQLILLVQGQVAYFGQVTDVVSFLAAHGLHCHPHYNPADFLLDLTKDQESIDLLLAAMERHRASEAWPRELRMRGRVSRIYQSHIQQAMRKVVTDAGGPISGPRIKSVLPDQDKTNPIETTGIIQHSLDSYHIKPQFSVDVASVPKWPTGFWRQYSTLCRRSFCNNRKRYISLSNLLETFAVAVVVSLLFWQLPRSEETVVKRLGMIYNMILYLTVTPLFDAVASFPMERVLVVKERQAGSYRLSAYYLAASTADLPVHVIRPLLFTVITYFASNLARAPENFLGFLMLNIFMAFIMAGLGQAVASAFLHPAVAINICSGAFFSFMFLCSFWSDSIPVWFSWARYISPLNHAYGIATSLEIAHGPPISCSSYNVTMYEACRLDMLPHPEKESTTHWTINTSQPNPDVDIDDTMALPSAIPPADIMIRHGLLEAVWIHVLMLCIHMVLYRFACYGALRFMYRRSR